MMELGPSPSWLQELLACPHCHGTIADTGGEWHCDRCGVVGGRTLGFPDFLVGRAPLPVAGGDHMDLTSDQKAGEDLWAAARRESFPAVAVQAASMRVDAGRHNGWSPGRQRACERFHANLSRINSEGARRGGEALLAKVDGKLTELGWNPLGRTIGLEAGGGAGYFIPGFAQRFDRLVFVDASLSGLVLAAKLAAEHSLTKVAFVRADVTRLPFRAGRFDFVHENGVIEHVYDPQKMVAEAVRVRSPNGYYVCVSPNRMSVAPEPHFGIPLYGIVPRWIRRALVPRLRGFDDGPGTDLRSLAQLRRDLAASVDGDDVEIFFLPRHLPFTARQTPIRRIVRRALAEGATGNVVDHILNVTLLAVAPQHIVIVRGQTENDGSQCA